MEHKGDRPSRLTPPPWGSFEAYAVNELSATGGGQGVWMRCSKRKGDADKDNAKSGEEGWGLLRSVAFLGISPLSTSALQNKTHTHTHTHTHTVHELAEACQQAQGIHSGFPRPLFQ